MPIIKYPRAFYAGGRLTASSGNPIYDVTNASTLYYTPYLHGLVSLYDGVAWNTYSFSQLTLGSSLSYATIYDIFLYNNAGTLTLQAEPWTGAARNVALVRQDGVWVKTGYLGYLFLGSVYCDGSMYLQDTKGGLDAAYGKRCIWNMYNRVKRPLYCGDSTNSWTYTTATWRQVRASANNQVEFMIGLSEDAVFSIANARAVNTSAVFATGIGVNSTSVNSATTTAGSGSTGVAQGASAVYSGLPGIGYNYLAWLEISQAANTTTWYGDNGLTYWQMGLTAEVMM